MCDANGTKLCSKCKTIDRPENTLRCIADCVPGQQCHKARSTDPSEAWSGLFCKEHRFGTVTVYLRGPQIRFWERRLHDRSKVVYRFPATVEFKELKEYDELIYQSSLAKLDALDVKLSGYMEPWRYTRIQSGMQLFRFEENAGESEHGLRQDNTFFMTSVADLDTILLWKSAQLETRPSELIKTGQLCLYSYEVMEEIPLVKLDAAYSYVDAESFYRQRFNGDYVPSFKGVTTGDNFKFLECLDEMGDYGFVDNHALNLPDTHVEVALTATALEGNAINRVGTRVLEFPDLDLGFLDFWYMQNSEQGR